MKTVNRRAALLAAPLLATALVATGGGVAEASTPACSAPLRPLRAPALGTAKLRRGSRGSAVRSLQNLINHMPKLKNARGKWYKPCPLVEVGVFGAGTESRLKDAQRAAGLTPDGVVGPATRKAANNYFR